MAFAGVGNFVSATDHTSSTTWAFTTTSAVASGSIAVLIFSLDNNNTADGDGKDVARIQDTRYNTWSKLGEFSNGQGGAALGVTCSIWWTRCAAQLPGSSTITLTYSGAARTAKAVIGYEFTVAAGNVLSVIGTTATSAQDAGTNWAALTVGSLAASEHLWIRGCSKEANDAVALTNTAGWTDMGLANDTGSGTSTSDTTVRGEYVILTLTTATSDPTNTFAAADMASMLIAVDEVAPSAAMDLPAIIPSQTFKDPRVRM